MSAQIVREMYAAFSRGDIPAIVAALDEDVSWEAEGPPSLGFTGMRRGHQGAMQFFEALAEHVDPQLQISDVLEAGDTVAAFGRYQCTMKGTGVRVDTAIAQLWKFRDGKVVRYVDYVDTAAYVEAMQPRSAAAR